MVKKVCSFSDYKVVTGNFSHRYNVNGYSMNYGEMVEYGIALDMGIKKPKREPIAFDCGSDIQLENIGYSVKSSTFSLTQKIQAKEKTGFIGMINEFFERVHSQFFIYGILKDTKLTYYIMDSKEFKELLLKCATTDIISGKNAYKVRVKNENKVINYLTAIK